MTMRTSKKRPRGKSRVTDKERGRVGTKMSVGLYSEEIEGSRALKEGSRRGGGRAAEEREREEGALIQERVGKSTKRRNKRGKE